MSRTALVGKGTPAAHGLHLSNGVRGLRQRHSRAVRRIQAVYGRDADATLVLLMDRFAERLEALEVTADALRDHLLMHAPAPRDESDEWLCANPACRAPLYGRRKGTRTCSGPCRAEVSRLERAGLLPRPDGDATDHPGTVRNRTEPHSLRSAA